jgi:hypothetical protein
MLFTEFNIDDAKLIWQEEAREDGITGAAVKMLNKGMSPQTVADYLELPLEKVLNLSKN